MAEQDSQLSAHRATAYDRDWAAWLDHQSQLLRERRFDELDLDHLIDEVNDLGISSYRVFVSAVRIVLLHMLKWDYQPAGRANRSWWLSIDEHRDRIERELQDSPSYRTRTAEAVTRAYPSARRGASAETGLPLKTFPENCPYDWDAIVSRDHPHAD